MEAAPPSYELATSINVWQLIAPYLTSHQLCQAALVSRQFHDVFARQLWGIPTSHFGLEYNGVLDHLARFQKTLDLARPRIRSFTCCLHLIPNEATYIDDRPADWLKQLLILLPNLQSLLVPSVPFFDHSACQALQQRVQDSTIIGKSITDIDRRQNDRIPSAITNIANEQGLRLLDASHCNNLTGSSLAHALKLFKALLYLDLSYTRAARESLVLETFWNLVELRILKLRGVLLKADSLSVLAGSIGQRLCILDIRDNGLSSDTLKAFAASTLPEETSDVPNRRDLTDPDLAQAVYTALTTRPVQRLEIEGSPERGIAQLYISGNDIQARDVPFLMSRPCLQVFDIGNVNGLLFPILATRQLALTFLRIDATSVLDLAGDAESRSPLRPTLLPRLKTLVLSGVPTLSQNDRLARALIDFVILCAEATYHAMDIAKNDYTAPPARHGHKTDLRVAAAQHFALERIVLEMSLTGSDQSKASLTGDKASDAMWAAGATDFSFFREDETDDLRSPSTYDVAEYSLTKPMVDNLAVLSAFRKDRQAAHDLQAPDDIETKGYWPGTIRVERGNRPK